MEKYIFFSVLLFLGSCSLPKPVSLPPALSFDEYRLTSDSLIITVKKEIPGPVYFRMVSEQAELSEALEPLMPLVLTDEDPVQQIEVAHGVGDTTAVRAGLSSSGGYGDPYAVWDTSLLYAWPFPRGKSYKIIQGYNGSFSHNKVDSRYAVDFSLAVGDTVCAAQDGLVMSVLQENTIGGRTLKYRPYANYITLYHADGLITQYVHLAPNSALVEAGDEVKKGQPIGLSGETGFTDGPHLHFNVYRPDLEGTKSAPIIFEKAAGKELKKGMPVSH
jgi:murein DD-endopeptidase MepM/ murein hydrolase activator NlpD